MPVTVEPTAGKEPDSERETIEPPVREDGAGTDVDSDD
jgi:hypothetical protein